MSKYAATLSKVLRLIKKISIIYLPLIFKDGKDL
jgi:hypothetical protein